MKNFIITLVLTAALIALFSSFDPRQPATNADGYGPKHRGDSGLVLPGDGDQMAEANFKTAPAPDPVEEQAVGDKKATTKEVSQEIQAESQETSEELKKGENDMYNIVLSFWHGVATVLIGETVALMVAIAWMKIKGGK